MASKKYHFPGFSIVDANIRINVNMDRFSEQYQMAQYKLDGMIMTSMVPLMPHETGTFVNVTRAQSAALQGTGEVIAAAAPTGRFLYEGKVMIDPVTKSPWARKGAKKVVTDRELKFGNPKAVPHWFDMAKERDLKKWLKGTKSTAGGGIRGK